MNNLDGELAPPMANGEVVFEAPWQSRVFGMAQALCEAGCYDWDEFREKLIAEIGAHDAARTSDDAYHYFEHFQAALQALLVEKGMLSGDEIATRFNQFESRPHGHDH